jgi:uncharacterized protein HemY
LNTHFIPVQLDLTKESKLADQYQVIWTPNINVVDTRERVAYHAEGWLSPSEYAAMLYIGLGQLALKHKRYDNASAYFKTVYDHYPQSEFAPEALYYLAVGKYMASNEADQLLQGWSDLRRRYSASAWAMRTRVA